MSNLSTAKPFEILGSTILSMRVLLKHAEYAGSTQNTQNTQNTLV